MNTRMNSSAVREEAEHWFARLMAPDCSGEERAAFQEWRERSASHAQAFVATEDLLARVDVLAATDARMRNLMDRARMQHTSRGVRLWERWRMPVALAAGIGVLALGLYIGARWLWVPAPPVLYTTQFAPRTIELKDGSRVQLDARSVLAVGPDPRKAELRAGRALFEVSDNPGEPFVVRAASGRVWVLGTRFQVDRAGEHVSVTLAEGAVAVSRNSKAGEPRNIEHLKPGQQLVFAADPGSWQVHEVDAEFLTSWSRGRLVFRGMPLGEALVQINRYLRHKIELGDPALGELSVQGSFLAGDGAATVSALEAVMPLRAEQDKEGTIRLFKRK